MIGCVEDAEFIAEWDFRHPLPDGWSFAGEGATRVAVISPDGIVYKVELSPDGSNSNEYMNIQRIKKLPPIKGWEIADASLYILDNFKSVIAMEYIEGSDDIECGSYLGPEFKCTCKMKPCVAYVWEVTARLWGVWDLTSDNIRVQPDGTRIVIDAVS